MMHSDGDEDKVSKRWRKKKTKKMSVEYTTTEDNLDDERIEADVRLQIENAEVPVSLPDKAVCIQIHTGIDECNKTAVIASTKTSSTCVLLLA